MSGDSGGHRRIRAESASCGSGSLRNRGCRDREKAMGSGGCVAGVRTGLAHHHTILFLVPMMIALWPRGKDSVKIPGGTVFVCIVAPLLLYLLLPVMAKNTPEYSQTGFKFRDFVQNITRAEYVERAANQNPSEQLVRPRDIIKRSIGYLGKQFGWFLFAIGVIGWFFAGKGRKMWATWAVITTIIWLFAMAFLSRGSPARDAVQFPEVGRQIHDPDQYVCRDGFRVDSRAGGGYADIALRYRRHRGSEFHSVAIYSGRDLACAMRNSAVSWISECEIFIVRASCFRAGSGKEFSSSRFRKTACSF